MTVGACHVEGLLHGAVTEEILEDCGGQEEVVEDTILGQLVLDEGDGGNNSSTLLDTGVLKPRPGPHTSTACEAGLSVIYKR